MVIVYLKKNNQKQNVVFSYGKKTKSLKVYDDKCSDDRKNNINKTKINISKRKQ